MSLRGAVLRDIFERPETVIMPMGTLPIHAQMAEHLGFEAFELSGGLSAFYVEGVPDAGYLTMTEVVAHARRIVRSVDIPVFCDADTGYGAPISVQRTVEEFIDAGVAGIHIEDQREPKKAGGQIGIELVSDAEAIGRLNAAVDARERLGADFVIVARTDGYGAAGGGLEEAIRRGQLYRAETGVDVIFYEGLHTWEQIEVALKETPGPTYVIESTEIESRRSLAELSEMGQSIEVVPFAMAGIQADWRLLVDIKEAGDITPFAEMFAEIGEAKGSEHDIGVGDRFVRPSYDYVRETENKFLPEEMRRDYVNNPNAQWQEEHG